MAKAVGIGGVFLHFEGDEKTVMKWYHDYLGLELSPYGSGFITGEQLVLLSFKRGEGNHPFLNLRVDDLQEIISKFEVDNIEIVSDVKIYDYGKFAQFKDPFGNLVELWEPYIDEYIKMVKKERKDYKNKTNSN